MNDVKEFNLVLTNNHEKNSIVTLVHWIIERLVLWRMNITGYGARPRANLRIFSAIGTTATAAFAVTVLTLVLQATIGPTSISSATSSSTIGGETKDLSKGDGQFFEILNFRVFDRTGPITLALAIIGSISFLFMRERTSMHEKWKYLAVVYNDYVNLQPRTSISAVTIRGREILAASLALDLLEMDMWNHNSFSTIFKMELTKALSRYNQDFPSHEIKLQVDLNKSPRLVTLTRKDAKEALSYYQKKLLPDSDFPKEIDFKLSRIAS